MRRTIKRQTKMKINFTVNLQNMIAEGLEDAIDDALKNMTANFGTLAVGMEFDLNIDLDACEATYNLIEEEYLDLDVEE